MAGVDGGTEGVVSVFVVAVVGLVAGATVGGIVVGGGGASGATVICSLLMQVLVGVPAMCNNQV